METSDDELDFLRTKALLLGMQVVLASPIPNRITQWAVITAGSDFFRFHKYRDFYSTEHEALKHGIELALEGAELLDPEKL